MPNHLSKWIRYSVLAIAFSGALFLGSILIIAQAQADPLCRGRSGTIKSTLWGPIVGAKMQSTIGMPLGCQGSYSNENGLYGLIYRIPPCPGFSFSYSSSILAEMYYVNFNPKAESPIGLYYEMRNAGFDHCAQFFEGAGGSSSLNSVITRIALIGIQAPAPLISQPIHVDFNIDYAVVSGLATIRNDSRFDLGIGIDSELVGTIPIAEPATGSQEAKTEYAYNTRLFQVDFGSTL